MKDYYKNDENFILGYKIRKKNIVVKFSNGKKIKVDKSEKEKIDLIMKKQIENYSKQDLEKEENKVYKLIVFFGVCLILGLLATFAFSFKSIIYCFISGGFSIASGVAACNNLYKSSKIYNIMKNVEYVSNEEEINEEIKKGDLLNNCPRKAKKVVLKSQAKRFDINSIDKLSYKELKELLEVIQKINYLNNSNETKEEEKRLQLTNNEQKN